MSATVRVHKRLLLVWLLPYLLLTLADGGLHNHGLVTTSPSMFAGSRAIAHAVSSPQGTPSSRDCPACQWLLTTNACSAAHAGPAAALPSQSAALAIPDAVTLDILSPHASRAPPLA
jgi:hypothetical protein